MTVLEGLQGNAWVCDIMGELSVAGMVQYMALWDAIHAVQCEEGLDSFR